MNPTLTALVVEALADQRLADAAAHRRVQMFMPEKSPWLRIPRPRVPSVEVRPAA